MKRLYLITAICGVLMLALTSGVYMIWNSGQYDRTIKVGFLYVGDSCDAYTNNFIRAQNAIEKEFGSQVIVVPKYNVSEGTEEKYLLELVKENCDIIFTTSYGYGEKAKEIAANYPDIQFCIATNSNANEEPVLQNVHNFMGEIYQGRYVSGVVAGMKLAQLIEEGTIRQEQSKIGYVAAFPYAEVISGYTAFYLGVASVVPEVTMDVMYTNSWSDFNEEKRVAEQLIKNGCVIISQHSDTKGPAIACEEMSKEHTVYHVGYNQSMADVAPTTSLISSRINWQVYMIEATRAVIKNKRIESYVKGNVFGNDISGGFKEKWVQMLRLNTTIAAPGTKEKMNQTISEFINQNLVVFQGNYTGVNPFDDTDVIDLSKGYIENEKSSAPSFHYVLKDVIKIIE